MAATILTRVSPRRRFGLRLLYLGVFLFFALVVLAALSVRREWQQRIGQSRADAIFQLVQGRAPSRPTETPGATAWLNLELQRYRERITDPERARFYGEVAGAQDNRTVPPVFSPIRELLVSRPEVSATGVPEAAPRHVLPEELGDRAVVSAPLSLRAQSYLELDRRWFAVTRRKMLEGAAPDEPSDRFLAAAAPHLLRLSEALPRVLAERPLPSLPGSRPPRVVRFYALGEDGTLVSLPLSQTSANPEANRRAILAEGRAFRRLPELPTFVSNEFYFHFDFSGPADQVFYSGLYLDLGGQGLVATITAPLLDPAFGERGVLGADLAFDIDWEAFARGIDPPMIAGVVPLGDALAGHRPWEEMGNALSSSQPAALRSAVAALAEQGPGEPAPASIPYLLLGIAEGKGAVAAFQVATRTWLVVLFPKTQSHLPLLPVLLSAVMLVLLLTGFELNRRRAEASQLKAEVALAEKQNLLNTMQVPLIVVDPNTDEVVFCNQAAGNLGVRPGSRVADMVAPDPRARAHYERMQIAKPEPRRAYGLPVRVPGDDGLEERYALVRSVAVTAPIEALHADERHRLGILFLLEPEADLAILTEDLAAETRQDERQRLAGLLTHGVDTLVRVLAHGLRSKDGAATSPELLSWLSGYVDRRLRTTVWLLDHWDAVPPLPPDSAIEPAQARATIESLRSVFALAATDPELRTRLHWDNGVLSARPDGAAPVFTVEIDWPEDHWFTCPVRGGFGFFLGEVLINAIQHGRPGSMPALKISLDRVRKELTFEVENDLRPEENGRAAQREGESYGGRRILERLARLFEWDLEFLRKPSTFRAVWRVPVSERGDPRKGD